MKILSPGRMSTEVETEAGASPGRLAVELGSLQGGLRSFRLRTEGSGARPQRGNEGRPGDGSWAPSTRWPSVGPLQNNGGLIWTRALQAGSFAMDGGDPVLGCLSSNSTLAPDQRRIARAPGVCCDIGACEALPPVAFWPLLRR